MVQQIAFQQKEAWSSKTKTTIQSDYVAKFLLVKLTFDLQANRRREHRRREEISPHLVICTKIWSFKLAPD